MWAIAFLQASRSFSGTEFALSPGDLSRVKACIPGKCPRVSEPPLMLHNGPVHLIGTLTIQAHGQYMLAKSCSHFGVQPLSSFTRTLVSDQGQIPP